MSEGRVLGLMASIEALAEGKRNYMAIYPDDAKILLSYMSANSPHAATRVVQEEAPKPLPQCVQPDITHRLLLIIEALVKR